MSREDSFTRFGGFFIYRFMAHPHYMYSKDPADQAEFSQNKDLSMACKSCVHHAYVWGARVCLKHDGLAGNKLAICQDYRASTKSAHQKLQDARQNLAAIFQG